MQEKIRVFLRGSVDQLANAFGVNCQFSWKRRNRMSARQAASTGETRQEAARRPSQARHGKSVLWRTGSLTSDSPALSTDNQKHYLSTAVPADWG